MHPDLLRRIANYVESNPGTGLPSEPDKLEEALAFSEAIVANKPLFEFLGAIVVRHYLTWSGGLAAGVHQLEARQLLADVAIEQSNDLCAALDAYSSDDDPDRERPMTLAGLMAQWLHTSLTS